MKHNFATFCYDLLHLPIVCLSFFCDHVCLSFAYHLPIGVSVTDHIWPRLPIICLSLQRSFSLVEGSIRRVLVKWWWREVKWCSEWLRMILKDRVKGSCEGSKMKGNFLHIEGTWIYWKLYEGLSEGFHEGSRLKCWWWRVFHTIWKGLEFSWRDAWRVSDEGFELKGIWIYVKICEGFFQK